MATAVQGSTEGVPLTIETTESDKNDTKKRRFLWGLRRMFRRRSARNEQEVREPVGTPGPPNSRGRTSNNQLLTDDESPKRKRQQSGLSVSHDSVFTAEASGGDSDDERSRPRLRPSMAKGVPAELAAAVRRRARGDTSEEDEDLGLPRSPPASPPKYPEELQVNSSVPPPILPRKRGQNRGRAGQTGAEQSSCSEGSLLSAGSSDPDDEFRSSSDLVSSIPFPPISILQDSSDQNAEEPPSGLAPLSHSAARHKMAVKPRRTHGPPRRVKPNQMSPGTVLPSTPEVNEDAPRSATPETITSVYHNSSETTVLSTQQTTITRQVITSSNIHHERFETQNSKILNDQVPKETRLKSSSLPAGLALSQLIGHGGVSPIKLSVSSNEGLGDANRVGRSVSNAQKKDSSDSDENILSDEQSEHYYPYKQKNMDNKLSNILVGELHKKFGSVSEDEEAANSGNFESVRHDIRYKKNERRIEKSITSENIPQLQSNTEKVKIKDMEEHHEKHSNKKEESFFGRLLLRKSGKKTKKDAINDKDEDDDDKKTLSIPNQKFVVEHDIIRQTKMTCSDQNAHKSVGQKVFSNQSHKRIDPRGGYVNDPITQESLHTYPKSSSAEFAANEAKHFTERERYHSESQYFQTSLKGDDGNSKRLSADNISKSSSQNRLRQRVEPLDIPVSPDLQRKPPVLPRSTNESKSFFPIMNQGKVYPSKDNSRYIKNSHSPSKIVNDEFQFPNSTSPKIKMPPENLNFTPSNHSTGLSTDIGIKPLSYSVSPPRSVWPQSYEMSSHMKSNSQGSLDLSLTKNTKSDYENRHLDYSANDEDDHSKSKPKIAGLSSYQQKISQIGNQADADSETSYTDSLASKTTVIKSHSFRLSSDPVVSNAQQDMPSLPPIFGISEASMDSWESTYKKNLKESIDPPSSLELGSDSLISYTYKSNTTHYTDRNVFIIPDIDVVQKDTLSNDNLEASGQGSHYIKNISRSKVRDTDISTIEANIDSIIGSPKPLTCVALKSSSLDSVKSFTEKSPDPKRKAMSNESISQNKIYVNHSVIPDVVGSISFNPKININLTNGKDETSSTQIQSTVEQPPAFEPPPSESHISVTVLNTTNETLVTKGKSNISVTSKQPESNNNQIANEKPTKIPIPQRDKFATSSDSSIPEFMKIQLNKVDQKPASNVVLSTSVTMDNKSPKSVKSDKTYESRPKNIEIERSISYEPKKAEKIITSEIKKSESCDKNIAMDPKENSKPHRKFSSEDVEILEKSDITSSSLKKNGIQGLNRSTEVLNTENSTMVNNTTKNGNDKVPTPTSLKMRKSSAPVSMIPPASPPINKPFMRKKSDSDADSLKRHTISVPESKLETTMEKISNFNYNSSIKRMSSQEMLLEQASRTDRSSSSSDDANLESAVIYRKKSLASMKNNNKKDDEPELMKVFARRSLKLKDSESEALAQDILNATNNASTENESDQSDESKRNSKNLNMMSRSRDSDKENEANSPKEERKKSINSITDTNTEISQTNNVSKSISKSFLEYKKQYSETVELMQAQRMPKKLLDSNPINVNNTNNFQVSKSSFCMGNYQKTITSNAPMTQTTNAKLETKTDSNPIKKDAPDSIPDKRFRNRTFPDTNNENGKEELNNKNTNGKNETTNYPVDTSSLPKRPWSQIRSDADQNKDNLLKGPFRKSSFVTTDVKAQTNNKSEEKTNDVIPTEPENGTPEKDTDDSPQFKGILQMRAEWERRAQQAMTK